MSSVNWLQSGDSRGTLGDIGSDGALRSFPGDSTVATTEVYVGTVPVVLVAAREGRRAVQIQNKHDAGILYIRLDNSVPPSPLDLQVYPGDTYTFPSGVSWEGQIGGLSDTPMVPGESAGGLTTGV